MGEAKKISKKSNEEKLITLKPESVEFTFNCDGAKIAVLDSSMLNNKEAKSKLYLGKILDKGDYNELVALTEEEYEKASKQYKKILDAFSEEEE